MREFKITTLHGNIYIYPVPVMKESKYLISCEFLQEAHELMSSSKRFQRKKSNIRMMRERIFCSSLFTVTNKPKSLS